MISEVWPLGLPQIPLTNGFSMTIGRSEVIKSDMDTGPSKRRRRSMSAPRPMKVSMVLTINQVLLFEEWYDNTIMGGVKPFKWVNPLTGAETYFQIQDPENRPTISPESNSGQYFSLTLDLAIIP
ncbi:MAG: hypothetical protein NC124_02315 [Clostridium sp.]|nr:hypothetical protein [Clostridium sp.]